MMSLCILCIHTGVEVDEGDIKPSEHYLEEVREYFRQHVSEDSLSRVARQVYGSKAYFNHENFQ